MNKSRLEKLADEVKDANDYYQIPKSPGDSINPADLHDMRLPRKEGIKTFEEIAFTKKIEIPKCLVRPVNGRIFVIETDGSEMKTAAGIIIPQKMKDKKDESMKNIQRYFVVAWAKDIPTEILDMLSIGIEVNPFLPQEAEEWTLPIVVDWSTGNRFKSVHYTEIAGVSDVIPTKVE